MATRRDFITGAAGAMAAVALPRNPIARGTSIRARDVVQTVRGPIDPSRLGFTLPHEHVVASSTGFVQAWPEFFGGRAELIAKAVDRLRLARAEGVSTIVDLTTIDVGRDIRLLEEVSRKSGVQIVAATGHWLNPTLSMQARTVEELTRFFTLEIERGIEGTGIKPGVIKVATDREGVTPFLDKALRAAARASKATGIPISTHTFAAERIGEKQAAIFESEGLDPSRVCLGHGDDSSDFDYLAGLARRGYTIGMDHLTWGTRPGGLTWQERAETVEKMIEAGLVERIFLSNDWYFGLSLAPAGAMEAIEKANPDGILFSKRKAIPWLREKGITEAQIRTMTVDNPRRFFSGG